MNKPKFILNPNAAPFIPNFKRATKVDSKEENVGATMMFCDSATNESELHDAFDSTWQPSSRTTEKILVSDEDSPGIDYQIPEPKDHVHQYETMEFEKEDLDDGSQIESEYLSSLFPNFSMESVSEVYRACGDVFAAKLMLERLEGHDDSPRNLLSDSHFSGASSSGHKDISSDLISQPDSEAVLQSNATHMHSG